MAKILEMTPDQEAEYLAWVASRPPAIREMIRRCPPDRLYLNRPVPGQRVTIQGYNEDGTVRVSVSGQYNLVSFDRDVFGVRLDDLEECDLPGPDDPVGTILTEPADIQAHIDAIRPIILARRSVREN